MKITSEKIVEALIGEMASGRVLGANQFVYELGNGNEVFLSYNTAVAAHIDGKFYKTDKKWSVTTSRHINNYLQGAQAETKPQEFFDDL